MNGIEESLPFKVVKGVGRVLCGNDVATSVEKLREDGKDLGPPPGTHAELSRLEGSDESLARGCFKSERGGGLRRPHPVIDGSYLSLEPFQNSLRLFRLRDLVEGGEDPGGAKVADWLGHLSGRDQGDERSNGVREGRVRSAVVDPVVGWVPSEDIHGNRAVGSELSDLFSDLREGDAERRAGKRFSGHRDSRRGVCLCEEVGDLNASLGDPVRGDGLIGCGDAVPENTGANRLDDLDGVKSLQLDVPRC